MHSNFHLLPHKQVNYKKRAMKNWVVNLECANLDASIAWIAIVSLKDQELLHKM